MEITMPATNATNKLEAPISPRWAPSMRAEMRHLVRPGAPDAAPPALSRWADSGRAARRRAVQRDGPSHPGGGAI